MSTLKWFQIAYAGGGMIFSSMPGILFEAYGSYILSYGIFVLMTMFIIGVIALIYHHRRMALEGSAPLCRSCIFIFTGKGAHTAHLKHI